MILIGAHVVVIADLYAHSNCMLWGISFNFCEPQLAWDYMVAVKNTEIMC